MLADSLASYEGCSDAELYERTAKPLDRQLTEEDKLIGRPIITACVDAFSGLCLGYSLGWEGGVYSLKGLMLNIISDKPNLEFFDEQILHLHEQGLNYRQISKRMDASYDYCKLVAKRNRIKAST